MSVLQMRRVQLILDVEVSVEPETLGTSGGGLAQAQRQLLDLVLADEELTAFFCRHVAAVPLTDWLQEEAVSGLDWLREEPQRMREAILRLEPGEQAVLKPVLEGRMDGELDQFYAAFRLRYRRVQVIPVN